MSVSNEYNSGIQNSEFYYDAQEHNESYKKRLNQVNVFDSIPTNEYYKIVFGGFYKEYTFEDIENLDIEHFTKFINGAIRKAYNWYEDDSKAKYRKKISIVKDYYKICSASSVLGKIYHDNFDIVSQCKEEFVNQYNASYFYSSILAEFPIGRYILIKGVERHLNEFLHYSWSAQHKIDRDELKDKPYSLELFDERTRAFAKLRQMGYTDFTRSHFKGEIASLRKCVYQCAKHENVHFTIILKRLIDEIPDATEAYVLMQKIDIYTKTEVLGMNPKLRNDAIQICQEILSA